MALSESRKLAYQADLSGLAQELMLSYIKQMPTFFPHIIIGLATTSGPA